jgi:menaquinone-dependent protoporphyrinogen IX oxidase
LVLYASAQQHVDAIANAIAVRIRAHGIRAEVGDASRGTMPPPQDYDAVVLGSPVGFGSKTQLIASYIRHHRKALAEVPAALFTVSASGTVRDCDPGGFLADLVRSTGWQPSFAAAFAGGEPLPREGWIGRLIGYERTTKQFKALCTDWTDVDRFADQIATELARVAVSAERTEPHASRGA